MKLQDLNNFDDTFSILHGDPHCDVLGICDANNFKDHHLYFCKNNSFLEKTNLNTQNKYGLLLEKDKVSDVPLENFAFVAEVANIPLAMTKLSKPFFEIMQESFNDEVDGRQMGTANIHPTAIIGQNVFIGKDVVIGPNCRLHSGVTIMSQCSLGSDCELFPSVVLHPKTTLGNRVRISSNTTIGSDGFGYHFDQGVHHKIWHMGGVIIDDDVEMGSSCSVDQGTFSPTRIGAGSKLDNQVHVAHNVVVGRGVILCGQVGLSGSCRVGDYCVLGGKAGIGPDCDVGDQCQIGGNTMVTASWPAGSVLGGHPARPLKEWMRGIAYVRKHSLKR